jgi:hypothetical protein
MSSKNAREQAETAFGDLQSQFFARFNTSEEIEQVTKAREDKTIGLGDARHAKEEHDRLIAIFNPAPKQRKRV